MTNSLIIRNARVFTPTGVWLPGWVWVEGGQIARMGPGEPPEYPAGQVGRQLDAGGRNLLPGLIDLHVHGAMGHEVMDADAEGLRDMACFYARHGVTAWLGSTWAANPKEIRAALEAIQQMRGRIPGGATLLGAHLEGPYMNPERAGAQNLEFIRRANKTEAQGYFETGLVRLMALAPEFPENLALIPEAVRYGVTVSAGHTSAGLADLQAAVARGLRQATHTYNAMAPLSHRDLGTVGAAMAIPEINCELICDNVHVHPAAQKILIDVKTPGRVILITDAIRGTGLPDGEYPIDNRVITIRNGEARLPSGNLAGSVLTMERALRNATQNSGRPLAETWPMSSLNAARAIGVSARKGSLEVGKDADLVILDEEYNVWLTVAEGDILYTREAA